jgi:hypothetical protein
MTTEYLPHSDWSTCWSEMKSQLKDQECGNAMPSIYNCTLQGPGIAEYGVMMINKEDHRDMDENMQQCNISYKVIQVLTEPAHWDARD